MSPQGVLALIPGLAVDLTASLARWKLSKIISSKFLRNTEELLKMCRTRTEFAGERKISLKYVRHKSSIFSFHSLHGNGTTSLNSSPVTSSSSFRSFKGDSQTSPPFNWSKVALLFSRNKTLEELRRDTKATMTRLQANFTRLSTRVHGERLTSIHQRSGSPPSQGSQGKNPPVVSQLNQQSDSANVMDSKSVMTRDHIITDDSIERGKKRLRWGTNTFLWGKQAQAKKIEEENWKRIVRTCMTNRKLSSKC